MVHDFSEQANKAVEHLQHELQSIRTGRANPSLVEDLMVEAYGTMTPLQQLAAIAAPEPRLIVIQPWDSSITKDIEKALTKSQLGITPVVDGKTIRLPFPSMTEERRILMTKQSNELGESARVRIRSIREDIIKQLRKAKDQSEISEDVLEVELKKLQQSVEEQLRLIETIVKKKHDELTLI